MSQLPFDSLLRAKLTLPIAGALIFALLFWGGYYVISTYRSRIPLLRGPYAILVNGDEVSWKEFEEYVAFAQRVQGITELQAARSSAADALIEDRILRQEAAKRDIQINEAALNSRLAGKNDPLHRKLAEVAYLKDEIEPRVVSKRSGKIIMVAYGFKREELGDVDQKQLALEKVKWARDQVKSGKPIELVAAQLEADRQVQLLNNGQALISFDNWERHKNLYSKELTDMVFTLPQNTVSEIIAVKKNPLVQVSDPTMEDYAYAFVKVAFVSDGGEVSYDEWLKKARASAQVNEYI